MAKKKTVYVPKSRDEVSALITMIGEHQRELEQIQTKVNKQIEKIKNQIIEYSSFHQGEIDKLFESIYIFAQEHYNELTEKGEKKTVHFLSGDILWRMTPLAVSVAPRNVKKAIEWCKSHGLKRFLRIKEELNKETMLREREVAEKIWGVNIGQKEQFVVKPSEVVEIVRDTKKLQKVLTKKN